MIVDKVRKYIKTCPYLKKFQNAARININFLDAKSTFYSIEEVPCQPILKKYLGGSSLRQFQFIFCSREPYGSDVLQNIDNSEFYEQFANWIEEQNLKHNLPKLEDGYTPISIEVISPGYAFQVTEDKARYQIELKLKYMKERK